MLSTVFDRALSGTLGGQNVFQYMLLGCCRWHDRQFEYEGCWRNGRDHAWPQLQRGDPELVRVA